MYKLGWINWARLLIWLVIGLVIYFTYSRHHSRLQHGDSQVGRTSGPQPASRPASL
jgi:C-terminus of AA_permease